MHLSLRAGCICFFYYSRMNKFPFLSTILALALLAGCNKNSATPDPGPAPEPEVPERTGESGITYQLLVYSFADSDGDGCGDFRGIESKLDYLKQMGVQALWLSPIHKASSYHGYDVLDYSSVNPDYGTEEDFKSLVSAAHAKGIKIYLDYVLNHTSKDHPWFLDAKKSADSEYRDYYIFSDDPRADIKAGKIAMIATEGSGGYDSGQWFLAVSGGDGAQKLKFTLALDSAGKPSTLTVAQTEEVSNSGSKAGIWLYYGDGQMEEFRTAGSGQCTLSLELQTSWGVLVRTSQSQWDSYKYGAPTGKNQLEWGTPLKLSNSDSQDILLPGMSTTMYHSHMWTSYFADLNYGAASSCETSPAFKAVCESADKWIGMGVDGFRLDAIKHIYHNASSDENPTFLKKFYDRCNASYKAAGGSGDIYMVGEHFSDASAVAPYYKGLPAFFEFSFWWTLKEAINSGTGSGFVGTIQGYTREYAKYRSDYIEATKLSNHDEDRAGNDLGKDRERMKLAAAVLLTAGGQPYIYQGEELGYWGSKSGGDEYVRTPIMWTADGSGLASEKLGGKIDKSMLTSDISVESQSEDSESVLSVYRQFGELRDRYVSLAKGSFDYCSEAASNSAISAWYRSYDGQKVLVVHNFGSGKVSVTFSADNLDNAIAVRGSVAVKGSKLTLGPRASAVFLQ